MQQRESLGSCITLKSATNGDLGTGFLCSSPSVVNSLLTVVHLESVVQLFPYAKETSLCYLLTHIIFLWDSPLQFCLVDTVLLLLGIVLIAYFPKRYPVIHMVATDQSHSSFLLKTAPLEMLFPG